MHVNYSNARSISVCSSIPNTFCETSGFKTPIKMGKRNARAVRFVARDGGGTKKGRFPPSACCPTLRFHQNINCFQAYMRFNDKLLVYVVTYYELTQLLKKEGQRVNFRPPGETGKSLDAAVACENQSCPGVEIY